MSERDWLDDELAALRSSEVSEVSLARVRTGVMVELRARRRRKRLLWWGIPAAVAAAGLVAMVTVGQCCSLPSEQARSASEAKPVVALPAPVLAAKPTRLAAAKPRARRTSSSTAPPHATVEVAADGSTKLTLQTADPNVVIVLVSNKETEHENQTGGSTGTTDLQSAGSRE